MENKKMREKDRTRLEMSNVRWRKVEVFTRSISLVVLVYVLIILLSPLVSAICNNLIYKEDYYKT